MPSSTAKDLPQWLPIGPRNEFEPFTAFADLLHDDVCREDIDFKKGRLIELYGAAKTLVEELKVRL
jgi:hypothetical protein